MQPHHLRVRPLDFLATLVVSLTLFAGCQDPDPAPNNTTPDAEDVSSDSADTADTTVGEDVTDSSSDADAGGSGKAMTDLLFVIDNSGSMCEEQEAFSNELDIFVDNLDLDNVSYHFGVTTADDFRGIPQRPMVAYGNLTSTPDPPPMPDIGECSTNPSKVMDALERAIACTNAPSQFTELTEWDAETRTCIEDPSSCTNPDFTLESLFPPRWAYRTIPLVIRSEAYRDSAGTLDTAQLVADLRCASFVGTHGSSFRKGLGAAVEVVSPDKATTNSGFIRDDSSFSAIFVTDKNDCTHDGSIDEFTNSACSDDVCAFENSTQLTPDESALVSISTLKSTLIDHLRTAKSRETFGEDDIFVAGIYGTPDRYGGPRYTREECEAETYPGIPASCEGDLGEAGSGDRYQRFVESFPNGYPASDAPDPGNICSASKFATGMSGISTALASWSQ